MNMSAHRRAGVPTMKNPMGFWAKSLGFAFGGTTNMDVRAFSVRCS